jgi:transcriptional regulator with XRE-family HTH domain/energy-coupling factor transporter ATP-binding protein EcfA2
MAQNQFANLMKKYMHRAGMTDTTFGERMGVKRETVYRWRTGGIKSPTCDKVRKCAKILGLNPMEQHEFLTAANCPNPNAEPLQAFQKADALNNVEKPDDIKSPFPEIKKTQVKKAPIIQDEPANRLFLPVTTRPIIHPAQFFGRETILERIFSAWQQIPLEHVVITGPRQSGKTSLLNYIKSIHESDKKTLREGQRYDWLPQKFNWVFVDFENVRMQRLDLLLSYISNELELEIPEGDFFEFTMKLEDELKKPTVIIMDNVESGFKSPELDDGFWNNIRHLGSHVEELGYCATSRYSPSELDDFAAEHHLTSPFSNVFGEIELGPFTENEAQEFLNHYAQSLPSDDSKWIEDSEWILENSKCWPVLLQMLCKIRLDFGNGWKTEGLKKLERYDELLGKI